VLKSTHNPDLSPKFVKDFTALFFIVTLQVNLFNGDDFLIKLSFKYSVKISQLAMKYHNKEQRSVLSESSLADLSKNCDFTLDVDTPTNKINHCYVRCKLLQVDKVIFVGVFCALQEPVALGGGLNALFVGKHCRVGIFGSDALRAKRTLLRLNFEPVL